MVTEYIGNELDLFSHAKNWKQYWGNKVKPYLGRTVLEVGAGLGGTTQYLFTETSGIEKWVCLEPDKRLAEQIPAHLNLPADLKNRVVIETCFLSEYDPSKKFDSILYIDVIEHIENDGAELVLAMQYLKKGGHIIIVVPAHNFLFSPFDKAIGHFRRYNRGMVKKIIPQGLTPVVHKYLDSVGLLASLANKIFLKQSYPTREQIRIWDSYMVPISRVTDSLLLNNLGKSVLFIGQKNQE